MQLELTIKEETIERGRREVEEAERRRATADAEVTLALAEYHAARTPVAYFQGLLRYSLAITKRRRWDAEITAARARFEAWQQL